MPGNPFFFSVSFKLSSQIVKVESKSGKTAFRVKTKIAECQAPQVFILPFHPSIWHRLPVFWIR